MKIRHQISLTTIKMKAKFLLSVLLVTALAFSFCKGDEQKEDETMSEDTPSQELQEVESEASEDEDALKIRYRPYGKWGHWGSWSRCSKRCHYGYQKRYRKCLYRPYHHLLKVPCRGLRYQTRRCNYKVHCIAYGRWGPWSRYSRCSAKCGYGYKKRTRVCILPKPKPYLKRIPCRGPRIQRIRCKAYKPCYYPYPRKG